MTTLAKLISKAPKADPCRPWPHVAVDAAIWRAAIDGLVRGDWSLLSLWGEPDRAHMALLARGSEEIAVLSYPCRGHGFPSVGADHAPAIRLERAMRDLH